MRGALSPAAKARSLYQRRKRVLPRLEALEDRTLLAVTLTGIPSFTPEGPGPIVGGQADVTHDEVAGAINVIAVDPLNSAHVYVATVNGGIWETVNADAVDHNGFLGSSPGHVEWSPLTDQFPSLSIDALAFLPGNDQVLYAGIGINSSAFDGGSLTGILRTTDGGATWQQFGKQAAAVPPAVNGAQFATGGSLAPGTYYMKYTYVNATGESTPSLESNQFTVQAKNVPTVYLPFVPPGVQSINIYLTPTNGASGSEVFYANNASLASLSNLNIQSTANLTSALIPFAAKPPVTSTITLPAGRLLWARSSGDWPG